MFEIGLLPSPYTSFVMSDKNKTFDKCGTNYKL